MPIYYNVYSFIGVKFSNNLSNDSEENVIRHRKVEWAEVTEYCRKKNATKTRSTHKENTKM
jgi:hypothetical protein